jgi:multidrug resistance efflux pump
MSVSTASPSSAYKKTLLRIGIGFVVVMALLTFFSGTLNNLALAKVSVVSPQSGSLQKVIAADGSFSSPQTVSVLLTASGKVNEVLVSAGDVVKAGDILVRMDMSELESQIASEKNSLQKMLNNQAKQKLTVSPDYTQQNVKIANDKKALDKAKADLAALQALDPPATAEQLAAAQDAVTNAQNNYDVDVNALNRQKKQDANSKKSAALDAQNAEMDIQAERDKIAKLEAQLADNMEIKAPVDGRIEAVNAQAGQQAGTAQPVLTMLDSSKGLQFSVDISNENAELMYEGDQLDIRLTGLNASVAGTIAEKKDSAAQPGQMTTVVFDADTQGVLDNGVQPGQKGDIRYSSNTLSYNTTLPNGAVREDSSGYFVLVLQQQRTPLGNSTVLKRVDVTVVDSDSYRSAVSGALTQRDQVVSSSDKSVSDGDAVRLAS